METIVMEMREAIDFDRIRQAGKILKEGGLVAFPTETVYGLGGDALNSSASEKIYAAKGRPSDNPLIVHIADMDHLAPIVTHIPDEARALAEAFWPGPLTMILPKSDLVPLQTTGGLSTVAVRMPSHPVAMALIKESGGYIAAPSANLSGHPSPTSAAHVIHDLSGRINAIIDGGDGDIGIESTIIDLTEDVPVILRPGYISLEMARHVLGDVRMDPGLSEENPNLRPKAPGMKYRHYAPQADLKIVQGERGRVIAAICSFSEEAAKQGRKAGIIASDETLGSYLGIPGDPVIRSVGARSEEISISRHLYGILREFDDLGVDNIYSEAFDTPQIGQAVMNRLIKAAGHQIIDV